MRVDSEWKPFELRGGDELLRVWRELAQESCAAGEVEFTEDVVEQEEWWFAKMSFEKPCSGEPQGKCERSLLAFGAEGGGVVAECQFPVVAMGADGGLAQPGVFHPRSGEGFGEGVSGAGNVMSFEMLVTATDCGVSELSEGFEGGSEFVPGFCEDVSSG